MLRPLLALVLSLTLIACSSPDVAPSSGDASIVDPSSSTIVQTSAPPDTGAPLDGGAPLADAAAPSNDAPVDLDAGVVDAATGCVCPAPTCGEDGAAPDAGAVARFPILVNDGRRINAVADGDSRVLDAYLDGGSPWPQLAALLAGPDVRLANVAQAGATTTSMMARAAANVDALYDTSATKNVVVVMIGVNDIRSFTSTSQLATPEANLVTYGRARLAQGWEVYLVPDLPAGLEQQAVWSAWVGFERGGAAASPPFATGIADVGEPFDDFAGGVTKAWSVDGIHPSQAGCVRIADRVGHFIGAL